MILMQGEKICGVPQKDGCLFRGKVEAPYS